MVTIDTRAEEVNVYIKLSRILRRIKKLYLKKNMRVDMYVYSLYLLLDYFTDFV